jgi:hypothetical protein
MCKHTKNTDNPHHYFFESGCTDNHAYLVCDICGYIEDVGILDATKRL